MAATAAQRHPPDTGNSPKVDETRGSGPVAPDSAFKALGFIPGALPPTRLYAPRLVEPARGGASGRWDSRPGDIPTLPGKSRIYLRAPGGRELEYRVSSEEGLPPPWEPEPLITQFMPLADSS